MAFFTETLSSNRFFGRIECSTDILPLFSNQCSKTNFHSMTQCPKTTNSVLSVQKIFTSPHGSTGRIHWKPDNPNTPPTPEVLFQEPKILAEERQREKKTIFPFFYFVLWTPRNYIFLTTVTQRNTMMSKIVAQ